MEIIKIKYRKYYYTDTGEGKVEIKTDWSDVP